MLPKLLIAAFDTKSTNVNTFKVLILADLNYLLIKNTN